MISPTPANSIPNDHSHILITDSVIQRYPLEKLTISHRVPPSSPFNVNNPLSGVLPDLRFHPMENSFFQFKSLTMKHYVINPDWKISAPDLTQLSVIDCSIENLDHFKCPNLLEANFSDNKFSIFPKSLDIQFPKLVHLSINSNKLKRNLPFHFYGVRPEENLSFKYPISHPTLVDLIVHGNVTEFPVLQSLPNLSVCDFSKNKLEFIDSNIFSHLPSLSLLNLSDNKFSILPFIRSPSLIHLDLSKNKEIQSISTSSFQFIPNLRSLDISNTSIQVLPCLKNKFLVSLESNNTPTSEIASSFPSSCPNLIHLSIWGTKLHLSLLQSNYPFFNLKTLNLQYSSTDKFPQTLSHLPNLKVLRLLDHKITYLPVVTPHPNLKELDLSHGRIRKIDTDFGFSFPLLCSLRLQRNFISTFTSSPMLNLCNILDLSWNNFYSLKGLVAPNLFQLNLSNNNLSEIPILPNLPSLSILSLSHTKIQNIPKNSLSIYPLLERLEIVDLHIPRSQLPSNLTIIGR